MRAGGLPAAIEGRTARIVVVGLGYVGLPTVLAFAEAGFRCVGTDIDAAKIRELQRGASPLSSIPLDARARSAMASQRLSWTTDVTGACAEADVVLLTLPTPVTSARQPDLSFLKSGIEAATRKARAGQLFVLESTTYPGTTEDLLVPAIEGATGLRVGPDVGVAYCPERYNPGDAEHTISTVHRILGAVDPHWAAIAGSLYAAINGGRITIVRDIKTAEAAKIIENVQRDLNIALINELALIFERVGVDTIEVLDAAATKWNFVRYEPGPGVGGHCLPVDPYYLTVLAERLGYHPRLIHAGRAVNDSMPAHVVGLLADGLNEIVLPLKRAEVAVFGVAYKSDVGDIRESPARSVVEILVQKGASVRICDPCVDPRDVETQIGVKPVDAETALRGAHAAILLVRHRAFASLDLGEMRSLMLPRPVLVDARHRFPPDAASAAGFIFRGVGRRRA